MSNTNYNIHNLPPRNYGNFCKRVIEGQKNSKRGFGDYFELKNGLDRVVTESKFCFNLPLSLLNFLQILLYNSLTEEENKQIESIYNYFGFFDILAEKFTSEIYPPLLPDRERYHVMEVGNKFHQLASCASRLKEFWNCYNIVLSSGFDYIVSNKESIDKYDISLIKFLVTYGKINMLVNCNSITNYYDLPTIIFVSTLLLEYLVIEVNKGKGLNEAMGTTLFEISDFNCFENPSAIEESRFNSTMTHRKFEEWSLFHTLEDLRAILKQHELFSYITKEFWQNIDNRKYKAPQEYKDTLASIAAFLSCSLGTENSKTAYNYHISKLEEQIIRRSTRLICKKWKREGEDES
ncbi:MAG: hypothetical protein ACXADY_27345 [Candidatus Hodarchaeales archaeon]|jgi:hypothetical protein